LLPGLSERYGVHRRTVRQTIDSTEPPPARKTPAEDCSVEPRRTATIKAVN
jgi:hypothetical protein